jgi:type I restriction enzyme, S subunit
VLEEQKQSEIRVAVTRGMNPSVSFKPSGIESFGEIPVHWRVVALKRVLKRLVDCEHKTAPAVETSEFRVVRTTAVRYGRIRWSGTYGTTPEAFKLWTQRAIPEPGDVIFTREAPAGEAAVVPEGVNVCLGQRTVLMKVRRDQYHGQFLVHMIYAGPPRTRVLLASQGSTVGHFNMDDIGWMHVLVPPLSEQLNIVSEIERLTSPLTEAVLRAEREICLAEEYRVRLVADVVTGKLDVRAAAAALTEEMLEPGETGTGEVDADEVNQDSEGASEEPAS